MGLVPGIFSDGRPGPLGTGIYTPEFQISPETFFFCMYYTKKKQPLLHVNLLHDISCYNECVCVCMLHVPVLHLKFIVSASKGIHIVFQYLVIHVHILLAVCHLIILL